MAHPDIDQSRLDAHFPISEEQKRFYQDNGFITLRQVLAPSEIAHYERIITEQVTALKKPMPPMEKRTTYQKAFLQIINIWTKSEHVKAFVFGKRIARIAAELMRVSGVRLYHDQALYKEVGGGRTPWHADQYYWPLASTRCTTAWIPLQATPLEMGPVAFAPGSHKIDLGRDLPINDDSERVIGERLTQSKLGQVEEPRDIGDVTFHSGWTFHCAGPNQTDRTRAAMTIIYMDESMRLADPQHDQQRRDWMSWCPGAVVGEIIRTPLNPVLYSSDGQ